MPPYPILVLSIELHVVAIKDVLLLFKSHYDMSNSACSQLKSDYGSRVFCFLCNFSVFFLIFGSFETFSDLLTLKSDVSYYPLNG